MDIWMNNNSKYNLCLCAVTFKILCVHCFETWKWKILVKFLQVQKIQTLIRGSKTTILSRKPLTESRLYWYSGLAVRAAWVIWKCSNCPCKSVSLGSWLVSALSTPNGVEGYNSSTNLYPLYNLNNTAPMDPSCRPTSSRQNHKQPQPKNCMYKSSPHQPPYCVPIYEINIQKEWHWPQNIFKK